MKTKNHKPDDCLQVFWGLLPDFVASILCLAAPARPDADDAPVWWTGIRQYATIQELDEAILNRLISRILVGEVKKIDGQKIQEVKIVYNFVGEIPAATK